MKESQNLEFRNLLEKWDIWTENEKKLAQLMDKYNITLFFELNNEIYGAPEESRILFAQIKNNEIGSDEDVILPAYNMKRVMETKENRMRMFNKKEIKKIKPLDINQVIKKLFS